MSRDETVFLDQKTSGLLFSVNTGVYKTLQSRAFFTNGKMYKLIIEL
jgi:hypothetical protein